MYYLSSTNPQIQKRLENCHELLANISEHQLFKTLEKKKLFWLGSVIVIQESHIHTYYLVKSSHNVLVAMHHSLYVTFFLSVAILHK